MVALSTYYDKYVNYVLFMYGQIICTFELPYKIILSFLRLNKIHHYNTTPLSKVNPKSLETINVIHWYILNVLSFKLLHLKDLGIAMLTSMK